MEPFATVDDYAARYGQPDDPDRIGALLLDASAMIASKPGFAMRDDDAWKASLTAITCAVVHRAVGSDAWAGMSSVSQGADGYSASASIYNPSGDLFLTTNEKQTLGICGSRVRSISPLIDGWYGTNAGDEP